MKKTDQPSILNVVARAPFHVYFEGAAQSISASNRIGDFAILPGHADFFSILNPGEVSIETGDKPVNFSISSGIMTVRDNQVLLFVNV